MNKVIEKKKHLSPSQMKMYLRCGTQYMFRYIEGFKQVPGVALLYGTAYDDAINFNFIQKISTHDDLPVDDVTDAFATKWDDKKDLYELDDHKGTKPEDIRENGILLTKTWREEKAPTIQPVAVQEPLHIEFEDFPYDIIQYADLIDDKETVIDNKTAGKSPPKKTRDDGTIYFIPGSFDDQLQLIMYALGYQIEHGHLPKKLALDYGVKLKKPKLVTAEIAPTQTDQDFIVNLIGQIASGIRKQHFMPNRGHMLCSKKYCGFWEMCQKNYGGKVKD